MGLLDGKRGIVYGLRNSRSAAWGICKSLAREGATFALTYFGEREGDDVRKLAPQLGDGVVPLIAPCDLNQPDQVTALHEQLKDTLGQLDFVIHSVAYARGLEGRLSDVSYSDFAISLQSSCYTLIAATKAAEPLLTDGASIITLTYLGGERVVPNYNTAGIGKAALESTVRYLASDLGPERKIRVNAISAGPMMTLSARGIKEFSKMYKLSATISPLRHATEPDEVGDTCAFLVSLWARGITGQTIFVDSGYSILGMPASDAPTPTTSEG